MIFLKVCDTLSSYFALKYARESIESNMIDVFNITQKVGRGFHKRETSLPVIRSSWNEFVEEGLGKIWWYLKVYIVKGHILAH